VRNRDDGIGTIRDNFSPANEWRLRRWIAALI
jgi:hypothetical protein